jgi:SAM-dependent methyltransferase
VNRLLRAPATIYRRWKYRTYGWDRPDIGIQEMMGGAAEWHSVSELAVAFLIRAGLQPHHAVLDAGCGPFRVGRRLISYLDCGGYAGFDGSEQLLTRGRVQVLEAECDLVRKRPRIEHVRIGDHSVSLFERFERRFDYILFHGVFEVMAPVRIEAALGSIISVMHPDTKVYATFFLNPFGDEWTSPITRPAGARNEATVTTYHDRECWHHTPGFFARLCDTVGALHFVTCHDYPYPVEGMKMAEFRWKGPETA